MKSPSFPRRTPLNNWRYTDVSGQEFADQVLKNLLKKVAILRQGLLDTGRDADLNPGWQQRVLEGLCIQHPEIPCRDASKPLRTTTLTEILRAAYALKNFLTGGGSLVSPEVANERAQVCINCPMNKPANHCHGCKEGIGWIFELISGRTVQNQDRLQSCELCGCALKILVHTPLEVISHEGIDREEYPSFCWQVKP